MLTAAAAIRQSAWCSVTPRSCVGATPGAGSLAFGHAKRSTPQPAEQLPNDRLLAEQHTATDLLDGDGAHPRFVTATAKLTDALGRWSAPQGVDENGGVEYDASHAVSRRGAHQHGAGL